MASSNGTQKNSVMTERINPNLISKFLAVFNDLLFVRWGTSRFYLKFTVKCRKPAPYGTGFRFTLLEVWLRLTPLPSSGS